MPNFRSAYNREYKEPNNDFNDFEDKIEWEYDKKGKRHLIVTGQTNINERVQASLESTKIENIIRRAELGDVDALSIMNGQYIDLVDAPKSLMEAQNLMIKMQTEFDQLPQEFRHKFDNDYMQYIATYGTQDWFDKLTVKQPTVTKIEEGTNNAEESAQ